MIVSFCKHPPFFPHTAANLNGVSVLARRVTEAVPSSTARGASGDRLMNLALMLDELGETLLVVGRL